MREEFEPHTWDAFYLTAVEGREIGDAADLLRKQPGAIYAARSRVMRRLRQIVSEWQSTE